MSDRESTPNDTSGSVEEQIPHSGVYGYEKPVTEFDNTTLHEAHEQGLLETPENPSHLIEPQTPVNPNKKRKLTRKQRITIGVAGAALGSIVPVGLVVALGGGDAAPNQDPGVSGPEVPGTSAELENIGIKLSGDQINDFKSGDVEKMSTVLDKVFIPELEKVLNDPSKISSLSIDPEALRQLQGLSEDALSRVAGETEPYITVCPTVITSEYEGGPCDGRPSILNEHEDVVLPVSVNSLENIAGVNVDYTLPGVTIGVNDDRIYFK